MLPQHTTICIRSTLNKVQQGIICQTCSIFAHSNLNVCQLSRTVATNRYVSIKKDMMTLQGRCNCTTRVHEYDLHVHVYMYVNIHVHVHVQAHSFAFNTDNKHCCNNSDDLCTSHSALNTLVGLVHTWTCRQIKALHDN